MFYGCAKLNTTAKLGLTEYGVKITNSDIDKRDFYVGTRA